MAREIKVNIVGDSKGYSKALNSATKASSGFGKSITKVAKIAAVGLGVGLGIAAIGLKKSVDAAKEAEVSLLKLQAQMKASGVSYEKFGKQIDDTITKQSQLAAVDDEELTDSLTNILRIVPNVTRALELNALAADISRAKGIDLAKAGELVGKVAGGNTGILSRYGIQLEEGATAQEALATLQEKFAGQAEAYGSSVAGAGDRARVALENVAETIGEMVLPLASQVLGAFSDALIQVEDFIDKIGAAKGFKAKFSVAFTGIKSAAQDVWDEFADLITGTSQSKPLKLKSGKIIEWEAPAAGLAKQIQEGVKDVDWASIGKTIGDNISSKIKVTAEFIGDALTVANQWIDSHVDQIGAIGLKIALTMISKLTDPGFWKENWQLILGVLITAFPVGRVGVLGAKLGRVLALPLVKVFTGIVNRLPTALGLALLFASKVVVSFISDIAARLSSLFVNRIPAWIRGAFKLAAVLAFWGGLKAIFNNVRDGVQRMVDFIQRQLNRIPGMTTAVRVAFFTILGPIQLIIAAIQRMIDWIGRIPSPGDIVGGIAGAVGSVLPEGQTGGHITSGGIMRVHRGENLVPARITRNAGTGTGNGSSGPGQFALVWAGPDFIRWMREQDRRSRLGGSLA